MLNLIGGFADVEIDFAGRAADVAKIRVGHFAGAVDDAAHDGDFHAFEMLRARFDARGDGLQIEQRAPADWAGDVIGLETAATRRLQNIVGQPQDWPAAGFAANQNRVANAVGQERADDDRRAQAAQSLGSSGTGSNVRQSLSKIGLFRPEPFQFRDQQTKRGDGRQRSRRP